MLKTAVTSVNSISKSFNCSRVDQTNCRKI